MSLTHFTVDRAKPREKAYRLYDGAGLYLQVSTSGSKLWRLKYQFQKTYKMLALGVYPAVSIRQARLARDDAKLLLAQGIDPAAHRQAQKASRTSTMMDSFEVVAREWFAQRARIWVKGHSTKVLSRLERNVFPWIGKMPVDEVMPADILDLLRRIERRGKNDTAHRALQNCSQILRFAVATGRAKRDMTLDLRGALAPVKTTHLPAIIEPQAVGALLRAIDSYGGGIIVGAALRLAPLVFVRPGELRQAQWKDIDLEKAQWSYVASKTQPQHIVPLSRQALAILDELRPYTGDGRYVFPSGRLYSRPMSENAILAALRSLGFPKEQMTGHGFRAMARTLLDEELGFRVDYIEHQLAHAVRDPNGRAYNRTAHLKERRKMMQVWADYLDGLKEG